MLDIIAREVNLTRYPNIPADTNLCTLSTCPIDLGYVNYQPNLAGNALFLALFAAILLGQIYLAIRHRTIGFGVSMFGGIVLEIVGYVGRIQMHPNPFDRGAFLMYLICLTIAPVFLTAGIYLCLGRIVVVYDPDQSFTLIKSRSYMLIFCACDILSLVLQAIGGGMAAEAADGSAALHTGTHVMVAGLAMQVASLLLFAGFCLDFALRVRKVGELNTKHRDLYESRRFKYFLISLGFATLFIFIRSVFRVAELSEGFNGSLANNETSFMVLDGTMVILACFLLTVFHPGVGFKGTWEEANFHFRTGSKNDRVEGADRVIEGKRGFTLFGKRGSKSGEKSPAVQESVSSV